MLTMTDLKAEQFLAFIEQKEQKAPLQRLRKQAWNRFEEIGLPSRRSELFRYVRLKRLLSKEFNPTIESSIGKAEIKPHIYPECSRSHLVFVNGKLSLELSDVSALSPKVVIQSLNEAISPYSSFLSSQWTRSLKEEKDPFAALNGALHEEGLFLFIPAQTELKTPLQILFTVDSSQGPLFVSPRCHILLGREARAEIHTCQIELNGHGSCQNIYLEAAIEENASLKATQNTLELESDSWLFDAFRAGLKRDSRLQLVSATDGALAVRRDYAVYLSGENGDACLNGIWLLDEKREAHTNVHIEHKAPCCRSNQLFKGVLADVSRSSFEGKIYVHQLAQQTEAYQMNRNLLLSDKANADSKPNLEIFADDVKASHGATMGQLDREELFYLKTRGLTDSQAKNLLLKGYCKEVADLIPLPSLREKLYAKAENFLA